MLSSSPDKVVLYIMSVIDVSAGLCSESVVTSRLFGSVPYSTMYCSWYRKDGILQDTVADASSTFEGVKSSVKTRMTVFTYKKIRVLTWDGELRICIAESVHHVCEVGIFNVEAGNVGCGWVMVGVWIACSTEANSCTVVPFQQPTLVDEDCVRVVPVSYQYSLERILLERKNGSNRNSLAYTDTHMMLLTCGFERPK